VLHFDGQRFRVGPDSAGANPGPACYGRDGPLAVTDCNVLLGRIRPDRFPHVVGASGKARLDVKASQRKFAALAHEVGDRSPEHVAEGFLDIAVEHMAQAIKQVSLARGYDVSGYVMNCFGGAGGQHACLVADTLGIRRFHLAGHDWGSATGWAAVMTRPERILSWSALSIAHPMAFLDAVRNDPDQRRRSRYILLFRLRWLPEALLAWGRHLLLRRLMYRWMPEAHAREYLALFAEPGALTAVLNYYRAMGRGASVGLRPEIDRPVLFIWGNRDPAAGRTAAENQAKFMRGAYRFLELDAGHWLLERRTDVVVDAILEHVDANRDRGKP